MVMTVCLIYFSLFFFFQAEDGIRDLVRSRGLGDVYKRQTKGSAVIVGGHAIAGDSIQIYSLGNATESETVIAVSYTHLTLPTSDLV